MQMKKMLPVLACAVISSPALALDIVFEYDATNGFFTPERLEALERAAAHYESYITNDVSIFVTLGSMTDKSVLARGGPYDMPWDGTSFILDFQKDWKGTMTFSDSWDWYSGTSESFTGIDLFSVAIHELGHVMGVGINLVNTWASQISDGYFHGANAVSVYGGPVPVTEDGVHWRQSVESTLPGTGTLRPVVFSPAYSGKREYLTDLDLAGLKDVGWNVSTIPEPETLYMLLAGLGIVGLVARRRRVA